jgi:hypothetical protein
MNRIKLIIAGVLGFIGAGCLLIASGIAEDKSCNPVCVEDENGDIKVIDF